MGFWRPEGRRSPNGRWCSGPSGEVEAPGLRRVEVFLPWSGSPTCEGQEGQNFKNSSFLTWEGTESGILRWSSSLTETRWECPKFGSVDGPEEGIWRRVVADVLWEEGGRVFTYPTPSPSFFVTSLKTLASYYERPRAPRHSVLETGAPSSSPRVPASYPDQSPTLRV